MIEKKSWQEFRNSGLFWWINMILHTFGWAIVLDTEDDKVLDVYPARVKFRGFSEGVNTNGYIRVSKFLEENAKDLNKEAKS